MDVTTEIEKLLQSMIEQQERKVLELARRIYPQATSDDIWSPQDAPALLNNPTFNYEQGILTGFVGIQSAYRVLLKKQTQKVNS
ncbi:MAG: hypothetical protein HY538_05745 [Deltaproteobacteria bacterium]|nr:hypothetical protein [Deltaproteobacteria bacterium]